MRGYHLGREPYHIQYYVIKCQKLNVEVLWTLYNNVHLFYQVYQVYLMGDKAIMERDLWITNSPFITRLQLDWITQNYWPIHRAFIIGPCAEPWKLINVVMFLLSQIIYVNKIYIFPQTLETVESYT